ncbi:MAG: DUF1015 family protein [bacterium]|nr:DUF1015 family protein [bacterium]
MTLIRPFKALRPLPEKAQELSAPPYDVLDSAEAKALAQGRPLSFLHISKPEIDLPEGTDPYSDAVYDQGAENLKKLMDQGILRQDSKPDYYFYRMSHQGHSQMGLVAAASVEKYDQNLIVKHELTREDKEQDRIRMIDRMNCQASPVLLTFAPQERFMEIAKQVAVGAGELSVTADDGVLHELWPVREARLILGISEIFNGPNAAVRKLYIADGHHRSASASKVGAKRKAANPQHTGEESYNFMLAVIYPSDQMKIMDYNRVVADLNGHSVEEFLQQLHKAFELAPEKAAYRPVKEGEMGMYLKGQWYRLQVKAENIPRHDPVASLDVSLLYDHLLAPILAIGNPRKDKRIDFVGGARGLKELERRVDSGEMAVAFAMFPTRMQQIMDVAEAGEIMPPKSTWFEPKLIDGLVCHLLA